MPASRHPIGDTRLCGACGRLIRYWPELSAWKHCAVGSDHAPELRGSWEAGRGRLSELTESERRAAWGDR